jgi:hypothetical protein
MEETLGGRGPPRAVAPLEREKQTPPLIVRDFRLPPRINGICALLGYYTAYCSNSFLDFLILKNGTDRLF